MRTLVLLFLFAVLVLAAGSLLRRRRPVGDEPAGSGWASWAPWLLLLVVVAVVMAFGFGMRELSIGR